MIDEPVNDTSTQKEDASNTYHQQFFVNMHVLPMRLNLSFGCDDDTDNDNDTD